MTPEERFERFEIQMEFLAHNQVQTSAQLLQLGQRVDQLGQRFDQLGDYLLRTARFYGGLRASHRGAVWPG